MRKNKLTKIIKESIKGLMNEQAPPGGCMRLHGVAEGCQNQYIPAGTNFGIPCALIDGQQPTQANVGTKIHTQNPANVMTITSVVASPNYTPPNGPILCTTTIGCSGTTTSGCDPSAWPNHSNWVSTWTNNGAFNSSNPNQPCNHICQKIQQWTNMGSGTIPLGPVQDNIVQCKLDEGNNQSSIHGCNC